MFKVDWDKDKITYLILRIILITFAILLFKVSYNWTDTLGTFKSYLNMLSPFLMGFLIAFLINPGVMKFESLLFKIYTPKPSGKNSKNQKELTEKRIEKRKHTVRMQAIGITYFIVFTFLILTIRYVVPQLLESVSTLVVDLPDFIDNVLYSLNHWAIQLSKDSDVFDGVVENLLNYIPTFIKTMENFIKTFVPSLLSTSISITNSIFDLVMAFIISIYFIADKERFIRMGKKITYAIFTQKNAEQLILVGSECNRIFKRFFVGKSLDSLIIGVICFICMTLFQFPYALLISVIVGITNMIPYFGPFIGAVPGFFIILFVNPLQAVLFLIFILALQQFDGIILGPRILGESVGIRPVWIIFAIIVGGGLFGFTGMLLGVPTFSVIYNLTRRYIDRRLENKLIPPEDIE